MSLPSNVVPWHKWKNGGVRDVTVITTISSAINGPNALQAEHPQRLSLEQNRRFELPGW